MCYATRDAPQRRHMRTLASCIACTPGYGSPRSTLLQMTHSRPVVTHAPPPGWTLTLTTVNNVPTAFTYQINPDALSPNGFAQAGQHLVNGMRSNIAAFIGISAPPGSCTFKCVMRRRRNASRKQRSRYRQPEARRAALPSSTADALTHLPPPGPLLTPRPDDSQRPGGLCHRRRLPDRLLPVRRALR